MKYTSSLVAIVAVVTVAVTLSIRPPTCRAVLDAAIDSGRWAQTVDADWLAPLWASDITVTVCRDGFAASWTGEPREITTEDWLREMGIALNTDPVQIGATTLR